MSTTATRGRTLESLLPTVLRDVELRHLYLTESRAQWDRQAKERREVRRRQFDRAKHSFAGDPRVKQLDEQVGRWERAATLRRFANALDHADSSKQAREWTRRIRTHADEIDPTNAPVRPPAVP